MDRHLSRWIALVVLLATLLGSLAQPAPAPVVASADAASQPGIARVGMRQGGVGATAIEPGDELLVRPSLQHPIQDSVFYFVLPDRFSNADHANDVGDDPGGAAEADVVRHGFLPSDKGYFHGGDLAGLTARLDYLQGLGVSAIWMTPVLKNRPVQGNGTIGGSSAGYHGYWITDFTQVDPHLGSNTELSALVDAAHSRGMKVFFDIITNHTADVIAYEGGQSSYRNKTDYPYKDASGAVFDDADYAGTETFPPLSPEVSFPYTPVFPNPADATVKQPDWLNNRIYYHNRGDSSFSGENSLYGDFFGLDDLFTEHPDVARGMVDIYKSWISDYGIDGYRIDTVKHVNIEFWQRFGPEIMAHAQAAGKSDFFMYGEVFDSNPAFMSQYTTKGALPATLDFGFQSSATSFASRSAATNGLRDFFANDDYYTDADSNAYSLPTFLGNHDMGRFGLFLKQDNASAADAELLARDRLAHALMFFSRGMPVVYYGDEQGFTGDGGDKDAREDMFASQVPGYNDNDLIGTDSTTAVANFNPSHPLYQSIKAYGDLRAAHTALRRGAQIHRFSSDAAGIYAFSRIERDEQIEYVVAFNNAETDQTATFKTYTPNASFAALHPAGGPALTTSATSDITVSVPALSFVIYRAGSPLPASTVAPGIAMRAPQPGQQVSGRFEVGADLDADVFAEVTFAVKAGDAAEYTVIGTDNNAPYRVFYDAGTLEDGTPLTFKAIVSDLSGNLNSATVQAVVGAEGGGGCPPPGYAVIHYQRPAGDYDGWGLHLWGDAIDPSEATEWTAPKPFEGQDEYGVFAFIKLADAGKPVNFIIHKGDEKDTPDDRSFNPSEMPEIWVKQGDAAHHPSAAQALGRVRVHYQRPGGDYDGWGLHLWGDAIDPSEATEWTMPKLPTGTDGYGVYFDILLADATKPVNFVVHKGDEKDTPDDRSFIATASRTGDIWLMQGDAAVYTTRAAAEHVAIIHYQRPAGDYGDPSSANFADYWGLHVWAGAQTPTEWTAPLKPAGQDRFGVYFRVPLAADATALSYILHKGDEKDLPEDQELDLATFGNEVWILQATPDYLLPLKACEEQPCVINAAYAIIHYQRPAGDYDGWGLHLWGEAIDPSEATEWTAPKPFAGQDEYGVFAFIKLADASKPVNFIIHKGDEKDTPDDRSFNPSETPEIWVKQGDAAHHPSAAQALGRVRVHYQRPAGDYDGWGLHLWGDAIDPSEATEWTMPKLPTGTDGYGVYFDILLADATKVVNFIIHKGDEKDTPDDRSFIATASRTGDIWLAQGDAAAYTTRAAAEHVAIIHYHRPAGDYGDPSSASFADYWGLHVWAGAQTPTEWTAPLKPAGQDRFGVYFRVPLAADATALSYIIHKGDEKDLPEDQELDLATFGNEVWILQSTPDYLLPIVSACVPGGGTGDADLSKQKAHWVARDTIAWNVEGGAANSYKLHYDSTGAITLGDDDLVGGQTIDLTYDPAGLSDAIKAKFPHLAAYGALKIGAADLDKVPAILKGQFFVSAAGAAGNLLDATGLQIPGALDDLYTYDGPLGVIYHGKVPTLKLWAPTARSVTLHLFDSSTAALSTTVEMTNDAESGVWSATGTRRWTNKFYLYEVEVYVPATGAVEHNLVTDPYAISLSMNSRRSQIVNLAADDDLQPQGWKNLGRHKPALVAPEDIVLYELHLRDFSINDRSVPEAYRGTYMAFTRENSRGMRHLENLAEAGLTHVHLLPVFDIATIEEDATLRQEPDWDLLNSYPPDSEQQQAAVLELRGQDGFNWGYDPYHYTTPEGSYSTNPDGSRRVREFREMVRALNNTGLRVVMDVVYNHTNSSGQAEKSVLDRVVPGYYHRLNLEGAVETSTCCQNTATEHAMMEKLMVDSVVTWATAYKVDGFRFDLMGHHMKSNMLKLRAALDALTLQKDGVDGKSIYVYGEGWNFGEVADNARGVNATQLNMAGTGIGSFNDRLRDAVRGGGPFSGLQEQGFASGLFYDPNATDQGSPDDQRAKLLRYMDQIRVGLAGNLREYTFVDRNGATVTGAQVDYNGQPAGYTLDPQETITYVEAHDNETLFDAIQLKAAPAATLKERVRMQNLAISLVMLSQGVPFFHAGQELLRSKSMDRNSYDSGDWFNKLDFSYHSNNWGAGLPPAPENGSKWPIMGPLLADPALKPAKSDIVDAVDHFRELLEIRKSSPLFRLRTAEEIQARLTFLNTGPDQIPGLLVMSLSDAVGADLDRHYERIVVLFNASDEAKSFTVWPLRGEQVRLHPVQANSEDSVVRTAHFDRATGTFSVPARTTAVFVVR